MELKIKLFNQLRCYGPVGRSVFSFHVPNATTVGSLLKLLNVPVTVPRTVLVNGRRVDETASLSRGDEVVMMSLIEGG
jgi:hypothetical protein